MDVERVSHTFFGQYRLIIKFIVEHANSIATNKGKNKVVTAKSKRKIVSIALQLMTALLGIPFQTLSV